MPESDTTVARPSSYEVASRTSIFRARSSGFERTHAARGSAVGLGQPAVDDQDLPGERTGSSTLHHRVSMSGPHGGCQGALANIHARARLEPVEKSADRTAD